MRRLRKALLTILTLSLGVSAGCGDASGPVTDKVLLISIDTLRADYLGVYNPVMKTSPNVDAFAEELLHLYFGFAARHRSIAQQFPHNESDVGELGQDVLRELRALGYIQ